MQYLEQLLYDLGDVLKKRHDINIYGIFDESVEDFLRKGIKNTEGVMIPFQGYMYRYEAGTENKTYTFAVDTPEKYGKWMVKPRTSWRIIDGHKDHYRHINNPPGIVKVLVLKDLEQLKEYLVIELEKDRKRRETAIEKEIKPAVKLMKKYKNDRARLFYLEPAIKAFKDDPSSGRFIELKRQMKSVDRE